MILKQEYWTLFNGKENHIKIFVENFLDIAFEPLMIMPTCLITNCHRIDGPAIIEYNANGEEHLVLYINTGRKHNRNGPSEILYGPNREIIQEKYYLSGIEYKKEEWKFIINNNLPSYQGDWKEDHYTMFKLKFR